MKWRDTIIGFISALLVTIIGGALIYYITKEPTKGKPSEKLIYISEQAASFSAKKMKFALYTLRVENVGNLPARNVDVAIEFEKGTEIIDKSIFLSSGPAGKFSIINEEIDRFAIHLPCLTPNEKSTISMVINKVPDKNPIVGIKSDNSIATEALILKESGENDKKEQLEVLLSVMLPLILIITAVMVLYLRRLFLRAKLTSYGKNLNNTAFLLLHQGLYKESRLMIEEEITKNGADSLLLSNHALCFALDGDIENIEKRIRASEFLASSEREKTVLYFNKGLISIIQGDVNTGIKHFSEAVKLSKREKKEIIK